MTMTTPNFMDAYDKFKGQIDAAYAEVREYLAAGRYREANDALAKIAVVHAKTSLSMRNYLVKHGLIEEDE